MVIGRVFSSKWTNLFVSNFLGVYNDNILKNAIIFIAVDWALPGWLTASQLITFVSAALILPFIFLSPFAGSLAIRYSKLKIFAGLKLLEIPVMFMACISFYFHWVLLAMVAVLFMGVLSCLYSPSKHSLIRDIGGEEGLSFGTGGYSTMSFLGILLGAVTAAVLADLRQDWLTYAFFIGLAVWGYFSAKRIRVKELDADMSHKSHLHPFRFMISSLRFARSHPFVNLGVFGVSLFWMIGAMIQMNLVIHSKYVYHLSNSLNGLVLAVAAIGIAVGCWMAGHFSGKKVKKGFILLGIFGMAFFTFFLAVFQPPFFLYVVLVFSVAFMGGFFQVPSLAMVQHSNVGRKMGDVIAYLNLITFILVLIGTFLFWLITYLSHENSYYVFWGIIALCLLSALLFMIKSPVFFKETRNLLFK